MSDRTNSEAAASLLRAAERINAKASRKSARLPALFFVTDEMRCADPVPIALRLPRGTGIILRHYGSSNRAAIARELARVARERGLILLIGADVALASAVKAHGVHWPEGLTHKASRQMHGLKTVAAHSEPALIRARMIGADAALLSPVFPTKSGADKHPLGLMRFAFHAHRAPLPVYALGGVSQSLVRRLTGSGAAGLAAIEAFLS